MSGRVAWYMAISQEQDYDKQIMLLAIATVALRQPTYPEGQVRMHPRVACLFCDVIGPAMPDTPGTRLIQRLHQKDMHK